MSKKHDTNDAPAPDADKPDSDIGRQPLSTEPGKVGRNVISGGLPPSSHEKPGADAPQPPDAEPERVGGSLTRKGMATVISRGGSVTVGGRVYSKVADLPTQEQIDTFNAENTKAQADIAEAQRLKQQP